MSAERPYHHGALRPALLEAAAAEIAQVGVAAMSMRRVSARAGVSHTAAAHHFGDKRGLLTALAAEGHRGLAEALGDARPGGRLALGEAYLRYADGRRAHFDVMFAPGLLRTDDPELAEAREASFGELRGSMDAPGGGRDLAYGAWALVHGVAVLWLGGNLPAGDIDEAVALFRRTARALSGGGRRR